MTDPDTRDRIRSYFEGPGFESLKIAYGEEACDGFRRAIRRGHNQVIETAVSWLASPPGIETLSVLDAGCGSGSLAVPLALAGARVDAVDFSAKMIAAAEDRGRRAGAPPGRLSFSVGDLSSVNPSYDAVVCIDVFARYTTEASVEILEQLVRRARSRLVFTYTPKQALDLLWLTIGGFVARRRQAPPLHTHRGEVFTAALSALGWKVCRQRQISAGGKSYFCCLVEARPEHAGNAPPAEC